MSLTWLKGDTKTSFAIDESRYVRIKIHKQRPEPAYYGIASIQGSHTLSRYGECHKDNLTLGITRDKPAIVIARASPI